MLKRLETDWNGNTGIAGVFQLYTAERLNKRNANQNNRFEKLNSPS